MFLNFRVYLLLLHIIQVNSSYSDAVNLERELFTNHSIKPKPVNLQFDTLALNVSLEVLDVSLNDFELSARVKMDVSWTDEILQWVANDYAQIDKVYPNVDDIWLPQFQLLDSLDDLEHKCSTSEIKLMNVGDVQYMCHYRVRIKCLTSFVHFPFDTHDCKIVIVLKNYDEDEVRFENSKIIPREKSETEEIIGWNVTRTELHQTKINWTNAAALEIRLHLEREIVLIVEFTLVPVILLSLLNLLTFQIPDKSLRVYYSVMMLLMMITLLLHEIDVLPRTSNSAFNIYVFGLLMLNVVTVSVAVIMFGLQNGKPDYELSTQEQPDFEFDFRNPHNFLFYEKMLKTGVRSRFFPCSSTKVDDTLSAQLRAYVQGKQTQTKQSKCSGCKMFALFAILWCSLTIFYFIKVFGIV